MVIFKNFFLDPEPCRPGVKMIFFFILLKDLLQDGSEWMFDFSAPWCPPCNRFLPHIRYASTELLERGVKIGYVDCQAHAGLCRRYGVTSYPTIKFIGTNSEGKEIEEDFDGDHDWEEVVF